MLFHHAFELAHWPHQEERTKHKSNDVEYGIQPPDEADQSPGIKRSKGSWQPNKPHCLNQLNISLLYFKDHRL